MSKIAIALIILSLSAACNYSRANDDGAPLTVVVFPIRLGDEIDEKKLTPYGIFRDGEREKYASAARGATARLVAAFSANDRFLVIDGKGLDRQQYPGFPADGETKRLARAANFAGAEAFVLCEVTRLEFSERTGHYLFEMYSVNLCRLTASFEARLIDARTGAILKTSLVSERTTHRVHRLFWDVIWIRHSVSGPRLLEGMMEGVIEKIAADLRL